MSQKMLFILCLLDCLILDIKYILAVHVLLILFVTAFILNSLSEAGLF